VRSQNESICGTQCAPFEIAAEHSAKRDWSCRTSCELFQLQKIFLVCARPSQKQMDRGLRVDLVSGEAAGNGTRGRVRSPDLRERIDEQIAAFFFVQTTEIQQKPLSAQRRKVVEEIFTRSCEIDIRRGGAVIHNDFIGLVGQE